MKKLLIMASIATTAMFANAASFVWGLGSGDYQDHEGNVLETGTAFFYLGTVTASESAFDVASATFIDSAGFDMDNYAYGKVAALSASDLQSSDAITSTAAGQKYSIILLEKSGVSSLDGYEGYYTIVSGTSGDTGVLPGATNTYFADFANFTSSAYTTSQMVPEPTSGLLMLLGMAGLALRRRRA